MIILDASFLVKLVLEEECSSEAENVLKSLIEAGERISTIDIALSEVLNALWKHYILIKDIDKGMLKGAVKDLLDLWEKIGKIHTGELATKALNLAMKHRVTVYDSLYIAAALKYRAGLATYDSKQREIAAKCNVNTYPQL